MRMGSETEYGIAGGWSLAKAEALHGYITIRHPHLPSAKSGIYIANGGRIYVDQGKQNEYATPETSSPSELVTHELAGRAIMTEAADAQGVTMLCSNVDPCSRSSWGTHENYECAQPPSLQTMRHLAVHLATRIIYCGAGGLHPRLPGVHPVLSPRACMLIALHERQGVARKSMIYTKPNDYGQHHRLHITSGESLLSHSASYLKYATTALVVASLDAKLPIPWPETAAPPFQFLQWVNRDFSFSRRYLLKDGRRLTAIEIQRTLLEEISLHMNALPSWAPIACDKWAAALDALESPNADSPTLFDWQVWFDLVLALAGESECSSGMIAEYNRALQQQCGMRCQPPVRNDALEFLRAAANEIYIRLHMLGKESLFERVMAERGNDSRAMDITPEQIHHAMNTAPTGRAARRANLIQRSSEFPASSLNWDLLIDHGMSRILPIPDEETQEWDQQWRSTGADNRTVELEHLFRAGYYLDIIEKSHMPDGVDLLEWRDLEVVSLSHFRTGKPFDFARAQAPHPCEGWSTHARVALELFCRINEGLVPPVDRLMPLIQAGDGLTDSREDNYHRLIFLQSTAWTLAAAGKPEDALALLEQLIAEELSGPRPRMLARSRCYAGEILRRLGNSEKAHEYVTCALYTHKSQDMRGDLASHSLPLLARLERDDSKALGILKEAESYARGTRNNLVLARVLCTKARRLHVHTDHDELSTLLQQVPPLRTCPVASRIMSEWDSWVSGPDSAHEEDYWGIA